MSSGAFVKYMCSARDPAGGFYTAVVDNTNQQLGLYHVDETAPGAQAYTEVALNPSLNQASASQSEAFAFLFCSMAVAPDGTIFLQTMSQLWSIAP
jgi:hypothetical protein